MIQIVNRSAEEDVDDDDLETKPTLNSKWKRFLESSTRLREGRNTWEQALFEFEVEKKRKLFDVEIEERKQMLKIQETQVELTKALLKLIPQAPHQ